MGPPGATRRALHPAPPTAHLRPPPAGESERPPTRYVASGSPIPRSPDSGASSCWEGKLPFRRSAGQAARKTDVPDCPRIADLEAPLPELPPARGGAGFLAGSGRSQGKTDQPSPLGHGVVTEPQSRWRRSLIPGRLCLEALWAERMSLRGEVWIMGPPLDSGRAYHPRPHPEKIIEQLDPERIIDLPQ